jgi:hypothetical protein
MDNLVGLVELNKLPTRLQVAYAARCARRVRPLFKVVGSDIGNLEFSIDRAIERAECFADNRVYLEVGHDVNKASDVARRVAETGGDYRRNSAARAAFAAVYAAQAARFADNGFGSVVESCEAAARMMFEAVETIAPDYAIGAIAAMRQDYDSLVNVASSAGGASDVFLDITQDGPLGPVWPAGPPPWFTNPPIIKLDGDDDQ